MLSELFLNAVFDFVMALLSILPLFELAIPTDWIAFCQDAVSVFCYFLPMGTVKSIITLIVALTGFRIVVSLPRAIFGLLPFGG